MRQSVNEPQVASSTENTTILLPTEERLCLIESNRWIISVQYLFRYFSLFDQDLKNRYEEIFAEYQRLPLRPETTSILLRKNYLTEALVQLEQDIGLLEKHQQIFIVDNYQRIENLQKGCSK